MIYHFEKLFLRPNESTHKNLENEILSQKAIIIGYKYYINIYFHLNIH